ncbi:MAG: aldehyde dehydrogenase family protein, partial [Planctomycetota bacterium]|nr:aldehyde dehydrogenase family protein [Planctomycetota bacterium]
MQDQNFIDGHWRSAHSGKTFAVCDAATGEELARVPQSGALEAVDAINAADNAFHGWSTLSPSKRASFLTLIAQGMRERKTEFAQIMTAECGKPLDEAQGEVDYGADYFLSAADEANRLQSESIPSRRADRALNAIPEPIGIVGAITPWNFPLAMLARKTAPALAVGCTQVVKPAELTPLTALAFAQLLHDVGLPAGV